jgi:PIN domain nuclease of toxin-antitoxin system
MTGAADRFSQATCDLLEAAAESGAVLIPATAVWEVAMQDAKGRMTLDAPCDPPDHRDGFQPDRYY